MDSREFVRTWLEKEGLFAKDSDYDGWLGEATMEVVEFIAKQGHSGSSVFRMLDCINKAYDAYSNPEHPIWQEYWKSDAGQKLLASVGQ